jgi:hypothetical protein
VTDNKKAALREAAEGVTIPGPWATGAIRCYVTNGKIGQETEDVCMAEEPEDATFIALANPQTVLELLDALEDSQKQVAELEHRGPRR